MGFNSELHIQMQDELMNTIKMVENGDMGMLDAFIRMEEERKQLETSLEIIKSFKDDHLDTVAELASEQPNGYMGYKFEVRNGGRMYSFKHIPEWQRYQEALKNCEERHKQAFIAKEKGLLTAAEDGEEIVLPEISYRKSSIILKPDK